MLPLSLGADRRPGDPFSSVSLLAPELAVADKQPSLRQAPACATPAVFLRTPAGPRSCACLRLSPLACSCAVSLHAESFVYVPSVVTTQTGSTVIPVPPSSSNPTGPTRLPLGQSTVELSAALTATNTGATTLDDVYFVLNSPFIDGKAGSLFGLGEFLFDSYRLYELNADIFLAAETGSFQQGTDGTAQLPGFLIANTLAPGQSVNFMVNFESVAIDGQEYTVPSRQGLTGYDSSFAVAETPSATAVTPSRPASPCSAPACLASPVWRAGASSSNLVPSSQSYAKDLSRQILCYLRQRLLRPPPNAATTLATPRHHPFTPVAPDTFGSGPQAPADESPGVLPPLSPRRRSHSPRRHRLLRDLPLEESHSHRARQLLTVNLSDLWFYAPSAPTTPRAITGGQSLCWHKVGWCTSREPRLLRSIQHRNAHLAWGCPTQTPHPRHLHTAPAVVALRRPAALLVPRGRSLEAGTSPSETPALPPPSIETFYAPPVSQRHSSHSPR